MQLIKSKLKLLYPFDFDVEQFDYVQMKINYVSSFARGEITAEAKIIDRVRETVIGDGTVIDEKCQLVAKSMGTYFIMKNDK